MGFWDDLPTWAGLLLLPAAIVAVFSGKKLIFRYLRHWADRTQHRWDDVVLSSVEFPLTMVLAAGAVGLLPVVYPLPGRWGEFVGLAAKLLAVAAFALFVQKLLLTLHRKYIASKESFQTYSGIARVFISVAVYGLFLLIFLDTAGIEITPLIASLGVGSIAVALALQDTLANLFSGIYLIADKPLRVGDYVELDSGQRGYVVSIGWRAVRIRMLPNNIVIVPNTKLASSIITNYYYPEKELAVLVPVGVDYSSDLPKVEQVTIEVGREVMKEVTGGVPAFEPFIRYHTFDNSSINFTVILRAKEFVDQYLVKHEFVKRLKARYDREGITIPFPIRTVHLHQVPSSKG